MDEERDYWVVVVTTCEGCNGQYVGVYDHEPSADEVRQVERGAGFCATTKRYRLRMNEEAEGAEAE